MLSAPALAPRSGAHSKNTVVLRPAGTEKPAGNCGATQPKLAASNA